MKKVFQFDRPTPQLVEEYVKAFDQDNDRVDYYKDKALFELFSQFPCNTEPEQVLAKVTLLNSFYSTQIPDIALMEVTQDIISMNIDGRLHGDNADISPVNEIAYGLKRYQRNLYSFASKYCSFHHPDRFPIVDSYSKGMLYYMNHSEKQDLHFYADDFTQTDLNNYLNYYKIYRSFIDHFHLGAFSFKDIDKYLWKYAKYEVGSKIQITGSGVKLDKIL